jgi:twitching motility protein PilT
VKLLDSLLDAIVRLEGDALVMHVGEKPYVITTSAAMNAYRGPLAWGQVELSSRVLTFDAVSSMLAQILPADQQRALDELGAIEHEILPPDGILDRFTVVAARGGEDVWVEVRRKPTPPATPDVVAPPEEASAPSEAEASVAAAPVEETPAVEIVTEVSAAPEAQAIEPQPIEISASEEPAAHQADAHGLSNVEDPAEQLESIVVALPGESSEEVPLDHAAEQAIQLVDDEPQGVPTEEEVDAMMAATASELMSSGLDVDVDLPIEIDQPAEDASAVEADAVAIHTTADAEGSVEIDIPLDSIEAADIPSVYTPPPADAEPVAVHDAVPEFELSPPPAIVAEAPAPEATEPVAEAPQGAPLFTEAAVAAAAPPPIVVEEPPIAIEEPAIEIEEPAMVAELALEPLVNINDATPIDPPAPAESASALALDMVSDEPAMPATEDLEAYAAVWSTALHEWASGPEPGQAIAADRHETIDRLAPPPPAEPLVALIPEMPMDVTPEPRHDDTVAMGHQPAADTFAARPAPEVHAEEADGRSGVVVPMRTPLKTESITAPFTPSEDAALMRTLRVAASRGAATVYVVAQSKPMIRVDGDIVPLESEPVLAAADVDRLVLELLPPRRRDAVQNGPVEWLCDVPEIGRVRCLTFRDHRGPGVLFRMFPPRAISADQLALTPEVQALCQQSDGLVLVAGGRASGKSTLLNAFVDLINKTRSDHVITIESQIGFVHESRKSFISQRETRGDVELAASVARAALREDPDVMMIEELKSADLVSAALEAAESGRLVLASVPAASTIGALERVIELLPADRRGKGRASLATSLRGVIAQVLLRRVTGGRVAAREILLNTPAVSTLVLEGKMFQLPVALDGGRRLGMVPLTDSLATHVREGAVHAGEAYRKALDRAALIAALKRDGVDTSFAERMA